MARQVLRPSVLPATPQSGRPPIRRAAAANCAPPGTAQAFSRADGRDQRLEVLLRNGLVGVAGQNEDPALGEPWRQIEPRRREERRSPAHSGRLVDAAKCRRVQPPEHGRARPDLLQHCSLVFGARAHPDQWLDQHHRPNTWIGRRVAAADPPSKTLAPQREPLWIDARVAQRELDYRAGVLGRLRGRRERLPRTTPHPSVVDQTPGGWG